MKPEQIAADTAALEARIQRITVRAESERRTLTPEESRAIAEMRGLIGELQRAPHDPLTQPGGHLSGGRAVTAGTGPVVSLGEQLLAVRNAGGPGGRCGSVLFWSMDSRPDISITAGTVDGATGVVTEGHIFCASKGDYYAIPDEGYRKDDWS